MEQKILLQIVKTWKINLTPEYRGFRCANCQKYIRQAWHYHLRTGGYHTPVHFCNACKEKIKPSRVKETYKPFTCDKCGDKMRQAWHIWQKKNSILSESHFCKKCHTRGIIYDLDGTIISTIKLHEAGWLAAGKRFNISVTKAMLIRQTGISNEAAALIMLPPNKRYLFKDFLDIKRKHVIKNIKKITAFTSIISVIDQLLKKKCKIWICTSAHKNFVMKVLDVLNPLKKIKNNIIWREMYKKEKPSPEALNLTIKKMGLNNSEVYYIGDAFSDYKTSIVAKVKFIYFCQNFKEKDEKIPKSIPIITSHKEIFKFLN